MQRRYSLKKNSQFAYVHRRGKSYANRHMVLLHTPNRNLLVGFSVSKKLGGAVTRNRIKRLLREVVRPQLPRMRQGYYLLIARKNSASASIRQLESAFDHLMKKMQLYKVDGPGKGFAAGAPKQKDMKRPGDSEALSSGISRADKS